MTGNVGVKGGGSGGFAYRKSHMAPGFPVLKNPYPGEIPVFLWTKAADRFQDFTPGQDGLRGVSKLDTGIRVIFNLASGMLINQHSNINDTIRILKSPEKVDLIVVSDLFMTPSAKFADIILPAPSFFESENVVPPWTGEDYLLYNHQAIAPLFDCKTEYDWIKEISKIMGLEPSFTRGRETAVSYTHLDVYKRQAHVSAGGYPQKLRGFFSRGFLRSEKQRIYWAAGSVGQWKECNAKMYFGR